MTTRPADGVAASVGPERPAADEILDEAAGGGSGDPVAASIELAVADAVDTIVDEALDSAVNAQSDAEPALSETPLGLTDAAAADRSGWAAARMSALQAAAATATAEVAKSLAETGTRHAKEQAAAAAQFSRDRGGKAAAAAQQQTVRTASKLRISGGQLATAAASNTTLQKISRQGRKGAELQQRQATRLRRRRWAMIAVLAAIVGIAVGLHERRRRGASANLSDSYDHDVATAPITAASDGPDATEAATLNGVGSEDSVPGASVDDQPS